MILWFGKVGGAQIGNSADLGQAGIDVAGLMHLLSVAGSAGVWLVYGSSERIAYLFSTWPPSACRLVRFAHMVVVAGVPRVRAEAH